MIPINDGMISAQWVSVRRSSRKIAKRLTSSPVSGIISAASDSATRAPAMRRDSLVMKPGQRCHQRSGAPPAATISEFRM